MIIELAFILGGGLLFMGLVLLVKMAIEYNESRNRIARGRQSEMEVELHRLNSRLNNILDGQGAPRYRNMNWNRTNELFQAFDLAAVEADQRAAKNKKRRDARLLKKVIEGVAQDREEYKKKYGSSEPGNSSG